MRYALYFSPVSTSLLWQLGCKWLGYEALTRQLIKQDPVPGIDTARLYEITRAPMHYGLHATLKAPFRLVDSFCEMDLRSAIRMFTDTRLSFVIPPLVIRLINDCLCLCPEYQPSELITFGADCVRNFDRFRMPLTGAELGRRKAEMLDSVEEKYLERWGYPYVLDKFRFHITLTGKVQNPFERQRIQARLEKMFAPVLGETLEIDAVSLFREPTPGQNFSCIDRFPMKKQSVRSDFGYGTEKGVPVIAMYD